MKNKTFRTLIAGIAIITMTGVLAGCGSTANQSPAASSSTSGTITATGSTALQPLAEEIAKQFTAKNPDATINVQGGGSGTGLKDTAAGNAEIGNSDVFAEEKLPADQAKTLVDHKVCVVGFAVVTNSKVTVKNLTKDQVTQIFTGKISNWKDVGGSDMKIVIINRPASSGTRATFKKYALGGQDEATGQALTEDSSGAVSKAIKATDGAVSYLASSYLVDATAKAGLNILQFDGVDMTPENISSGKYTVWSYEHMYTKGEAKDLTKSYIDFLTGNDMKATISKLGYIPISDMKTSR